LLADIRVAGARFGFVEVGADLAEHVFVARFFQIRKNHGLGVGVGIRLAHAHQAGSPKAQQLVAARHNLEVLLLGERIPRLFGALPIIECAHLRTFRYPEPQGDIESPHRCVQ
jgi:hypothetical protein